MTDQLTAVLIGALIALPVPIITLFLGHKKWKKEKQLEYLRSKRNRMEQQFENLKRQLAEGMDSGDYEYEIFSNIYSSCPENVINALDVFIKAKPKNNVDKAAHHLVISNEMNKCLVQIDKEINQIFK
jgi:hypothetical protein